MSDPKTPTPQALASAVGDAMYARDAASQSLGMQLLETRPGYARVIMRVRDSMLNGHQTCHGGFIFSLADSAFAFACNSHNRVTVAAGAAIDFLAPGRLGDELIATAEERARSKCRSSASFCGIRSAVICSAVHAGTLMRVERRTNGLTSPPGSRLSTAACEPAACRSSARSAAHSAGLKKDFTSKVSIIPAS